MPQNRRQTLKIESNVQRTLVWRVVSYWAAWLAFLTVPQLIARAVTNPEAYFFEGDGPLGVLSTPILLTAFYMLPLVIYDVIRLSNRFVGPILRLRHEMNRMAAGEPVGQFELRENDYWHDLKSSFNAIAERLNNAEAQSGAETSRQLSS